MKRGAASVSSSSDVDWSLYNSPLTFVPKSSAPLLVGVILLYVRFPGFPNNIDNNDSGPRLKQIHYTKGVTLKTIVR
jgi:hypothetical protein